MKNRRTTFACAAPISRIAFASALLLALLQPAIAAPWELPPGVKTLTVNDYPLAFTERGAGAPVVLVHGAGVDYRAWDRVLESPPSGLRLIAVSLRHYYPERWNGKGGQFSTKQHAEDLVSFIDALGVGPVHLVGHSAGGSVAVRAARARPDLVKKLVLMEGAFNALLPPAQPGESAVSIPAVRKAVAARFEQGDIDGGLEAWVDRDTPGSWKARSEGARQRSRDNAWTLIVPPGPGAAITCPDVAGLTMPVLLMQGEKTQRRFANIVDATHKCLPSAERTRIPEAGHSMQGMNPTAVSAALVRFLTK